MVVVEGCPYNTNGPQVHHKAGEVVLLVEAPEVPNHIKICSMDDGIWERLLGIPTGWRSAEYRYFVDLRSTAWANLRMNIPCGRFLGMFHI